MLKLYLGNCQVDHWPYSGLDYIPNVSPSWLLRGYLVCVFVFVVFQNIQTFIIHSNETLNTETKIGKIETLVFLDTGVKYLQFYLFILFIPYFERVTLLAMQPVYQVTLLNNI